MLSKPDWLETFETDRSGERVSMAGCLAAAPGVGLGLNADADLDRDLGLGLGLLDFAGIGDRTFEGVLGVRGVFGVGGSRRWK